MHFFHIFRCIFVNSRNKTLKPEKQTHFKVSVWRLIGFRIRCTNTECIPRYTESIEEFKYPKWMLPIKSQQIAFTISILLTSFVALKIVQKNSLNFHFNGTYLLCASEASTRWLYYICLCVFVVLFFSLPNCIISFVMMNRYFPPFKFIDCVLQRTRVKWKWATVKHNQTKQNKGKWNKKEENTKMWTPILVDASSLGCCNQKCVRLERKPLMIQMKLKHRNRFNYCNCGIRFAGSEKVPYERNIGNGILVKMQPNYRLISNSQLLLRSFFSAKKSIEINHQSRCGNLVEILRSIRHFDRSNIVIYSRVPHFHIARKCSRFWCLFSSRNYVIPKTIFLIVCVASSFLKRWTRKREWRRRWTFDLLFGPKCFVFFFQ